MDMGHELAAIVAQQATSRLDNPEAVQKSVTAYATVTSSIRRTIMLHEKLGTPGKPRPNRIADRKKIIRDVEDAIQSNAAPDKQETLHAEFLERLERPDLEDDTADRPIADIVTDITRDLGITGLHDSPPWKRRIPHDIAILNARAEQRPGAGPSEKLLALLASAPPRPICTGNDPPAETVDYKSMDMKTLLEMRRRYQEL
jgi:hypothetical protein